jgi:hypothetical protein
LISAGRKVQIPVDISPSVMPDVSVEHFAIPALGTAAGALYKLGWSTDLASTALSFPGDSATPTHARGFLAYDNSVGGSGAYWQGMGQSSNSNARLAPGSGYAHIVTTYSASTNNCTVYVNGVFSESKAANMVDGTTFINVRLLCGTCSS